MLTCVRNRICTYTRLAGTHTQGVGEGRGEGGGRFLGEGGYTHTNQLTINEPANQPINDPPTHAPINRPTNLPKQHHNSSSITPDNTIYEESNYSFSKAKQQQQTNKQTKNPNKQPPPQKKTKKKQNKKTPNNNNKKPRRETRECITHGGFRRLQRYLSIETQRFPKSRCAFYINGFVSITISV